MVSSDIICLLVKYFFFYDKVYKVKRIKNKKTKKLPFSFIYFFEVISVYYTHFVVLFSKIRDTKYKKKISIFRDWRNISSNKQLNKQLRNFFFLLFAVCMLYVFFFCYFVQKRGLRKIFVWKVKTWIWNYIYFWWIQVVGRVQCFRKIVFLWKIFEIFFLNFFLRDLFVSLAEEDCLWNFPLSFYELSRSLGGRIVWNIFG